MEQKRFEQIVSQVWHGGKLLQAQPLTGGMSVQVVRLDVEIEGEIERAVVRWYEEWDETAAATTLEKEFQVLEIAREAGIQVPRPHLFSRGGAEFGTPYSVVEFVAGEMVFAPADIDRYIDQYATQLAGIHQVDVSGLGFLPVVDGGWPVARPETLNDDLLEGVIRGVLANANRKPARNKPVLLHGDYWPGNVLWHGGKLTAVIDWEDAAVGEPLLDFAQSRSEVAWIFGHQALERFTAKYQSLIDLDYGLLPYWDLYAALRFVRLLGQDLGETAAFFHQFGRSDITSTKIFEDYHTFVQNALTKINHA